MQCPEAERSVAGVTIRRFHQQLDLRCRLRYVRRGVESEPADRNVPSPKGIDHPSNYIGSLLKVTLRVRTLSYEDCLRAPWSLFVLTGEAPQSELHGICLGALPFFRSRLESAWAGGNVNLHGIETIPNASRCSHSPSSSGHVCHDQTLSKQSPSRGEFGSTVNAASTSARSSQYVFGSGTVSRSSS